MQKLSRNPWVAAVLIGIGVLALLVAGFYAWSSGPSTPQAAAPQAPGSPSGSPAASDPPSTASAQPPCTTAAGEMRDPKQLVIDSMKETSPMLSLGNDGDAPAAPPKSEPNTTGWYKYGPAVGSDKGNVILTVHTYSPRNGGNALGNRINGDHGLKQGDVIRILDAEGKQTCYRYSGNTKVWVSSYDPNSTVLHDDNGKPQLAIIICWDYNNKTNDWDSRLIFYADLMKA